MLKRENLLIIFAGALLGLAALTLTAFGNPANMGFCIACFLRDIAGATKLHSAGAVQYMRPEIIGLILGAFLIAVIKGEFRPKAGSSPATRFVLGAFLVIGSLVFLGCPVRMIIRLGGGDLNALFALGGFFLGMLIGVFFIRNGFSLKRSYEVTKTEGLVTPALAVGLLLLLLAAPSVLAFSEKGPGSQHAPVFLSLIVAIAVGILAQRARLCTVGGMRDAVMFRDFHLLFGTIATLIVIFIGNLVLGNFSGFSTYLQPIAHSNQIWNFLSMMLVGWGSVLLGGCPMRQLILAGEGNGDSAVTIFGMIFGAAISHNFALASSGDALVDGVYTVGTVTSGGKIAVFIGFACFLLISLMNLPKKESV